MKKETKEKNKRLKRELKKRTKKKFRNEVTLKTKKEVKSLGRPTHFRPIRGVFAHTKVLGCKCWLLLLVLVCLPLPSASACTTPSTWSSTTTNFTSPLVRAPLGTVRPWSSPWADLLQPCGSWCVECSSCSAAVALEPSIADAMQSDLSKDKLRNLGWEKFKLLVVWPVVELYPWDVDDPLFNWFWLWVLCFLVINFRFGMNSLWKSKPKNRKTSKQKQIKCNTKLLTSQRRPVAFRARLCQWHIWTIHWKFRLASKLAGQASHKLKPCPLWKHCDLPSL